MNNPKNYILRRKWVGNPTCLYVAKHSKEVSVHSTKDGDPPDANGGYVFRWGTTSSVPGKRTIVNEAEAIHRVYDKRMSRKVFSDMGVAPKSWVDYGDFLEDGGQQAITDGGLVIVRPEHHFRGEDMILCKDHLEVWKATKKFEKYYISTYIKKVREFRVFVVSGRVVGCCEKIPKDKNAISWGCADEETGGQFKYIAWSEWPKGLAELAVMAQTVMKIDFAAVDVIADAAGKMYLLELNTAPSMSEYWASKYSEAFDYIVKNGKKFIPAKEEAGWKGLIHPAICDKAVI